MLRAEQTVLVEDHRARTATLEAEIASLRTLRVCALTHLSLVCVRARVCLCVRARARPTL